MGHIWTMLKQKHIGFSQFVWLGVFFTACGSTPIQTEPLAASTPHVSAAVVVNNQAKSTVELPATAAHRPVSTAYTDAINLASSAVGLGQQATSSDDWDLVVSRWEQSIQELKRVPTEDQHYAIAQTKIKEYERNLAHAKQRLAKLKQPPPDIALKRSTPVSAASPTVTSHSATESAATQGSGASPTAPLSTIPIVERRSGIPVIEVRFNGQSYPMILDTGASHTHITRAMANELGVQVVEQISVATASNRQAIVDVGYVPSIRVGHISHSNVPVSIGDAVPIGLLGNDIYQHHDIVLQANSVEFRPR